ncbi:MAG: pseudouridine-5'-phosphate glycosidase [Anaerolineales bacterium]
MNLESFQIDPEIRDALENDEPVVALESTVITHGLPRPMNVETARQMEATVRQAGALPATIALLDGKIHIGLPPEELERVATTANAVKVSRRDLGAALTRQAVGGTTVSATMVAAHAAGIRVFATGGIGGVHRGGRGDVSADLPELARTPVAVVCAGAKSILDLPRTVEWLETAGVPVIGWGTDTFPAFFSVSSGLPVSLRADDPKEIAAVLRAQWNLGLTTGALVAVPIPSDDAIDPETIQGALEQAEIEADAAEIYGPDRTPFLLGRVVELTDGASLRANVALLLNNAGHAAGLARALAAAPGS